MMMDTDFPRVVGDIGNAATWPFPVSYRVVRRAVPERLAQAEPVYPSSNRFSKLHACTRPMAFTRSRRVAVTWRATSVGWRRRSPFRALYPRWPRTTTNGIGNAIIALMTHRDQWHMLREEHGLIPNAADEALRYRSPVQTEPRFASRDVDIAGTSFAQGTRLRMLLGAANRDPERFDEPDRFDITRSDVKHLALGAGHHYCLGASLARHEITLALASLVDRFPTCGWPRISHAGGMSSISEASMNCL
jgi:hypothetical protein